MDRKGKAVNDNGTGNGEVTEIGYEETRRHDRDTRHFEPQHESLPLEHIEYAIAYRTIDEPEYQIETEVAGENPRLCPFGTEESSEYPGSETNDKREGDDAYHKQPRHYPHRKSRYFPAVPPPQRCDFAIERFPYGGAYERNWGRQHSYGQTDLTGRAGAEMPCEIKHENTTRSILQYLGRKPV